MKFIAPILTLVALGMFSSGSLVLSLPFKEVLEAWEEWENGPHQKEVNDFINDQYKNWKEGANCKGFADSFVPNSFQYCDADLNCINNTKALEDECNKIAKLAGAYTKLAVKPLWTPEPNYSRVAVTGIQAMQVLDISKVHILCFNFAVVEKLVKQADGTIKSLLWEGYYTMGACPWWFVFRRPKKVKPQEL